MQVPLLCSDLSEEMTVGVGEVRGEGRFEGRVGGGALLARNSLSTERRAVSTVALESSPSVL